MESTVRVFDIPPTILKRYGIFPADK